MHIQSSNPILLLHASSVQYYINLQMGKYFIFIVILGAYCFISIPLYFFVAISSNNRNRALIFRMSSTRNISDVDILPFSKFKGPGTYY